ncbi:MULTISPECIES: arylamine N-acetyltransferase family protein [Streptomyces]|uniref:Arylamine N-acetyltransferase n=1 Tax=Streptomyces ardesiacus TaxID=285564 RepID=A0ABW8HKC3_9ACTN|nr:MULTISPECIES: arylamine N-acetyltransferase [Streptomyces]NEB61371.1 arylamine N-acetyltransferase [Streptomyces diastaticus]KOU02604.1 acetyltransferase [Streptomyces sp. NRRL F-4711]KOX29513.1 acetyltransferase [Streptomyces sp. NRRL F-4707]KOX45854.1 acetyltransferase [Streptomyces sp. NRRL F-7442]MCL7370248.1 arylamine N-acetyltransferase [Streptomyces ardesiacus]
MADSTRTTAPFSLDAYLERIGWEGARRPDAATLGGVQLAHLRAVPFENLDALGGRAPSLDLADLTAKLVHGRRRGGYCYEHNTLFAAALEALGVRVTRLTARVVLGADRFEDRPRTHMALLAELPGDPRPYLVDVGFGALGSLLAPVPLVADTEFHDAGRRHRLVHAPQRGPLETWVLQAYAADGWQAQYAFTVEPFEPADYEVINWHVATNPRSPFSRRPYVQRLAPDAHLLLDGDRLTVTHTADGTVTERKLSDEAEARRVLAEEFGIDAPEGLTLLGD